MQTRNLALVAAAAAALLGASAQASDFTGRELQTQQEAANAQKGNKNRVNWRYDGGYRFINRSFDGGFGADEDFDSHEFGANLTGSYRNWFLTGGFSMSLASEDLGIFDTDTWGGNVSAGYQFRLNRNLTIAPFIGGAWANTEFDGPSGDSDIGVGGFNFGVGAKWTPGYSSSKKYPKWAIFGAFNYFPSLAVSDDLDDAGVEGDNGWTATLGVEHNFNPRTFATVYYQFARFDADGPVGTDFRQEDHRLGVSAGIRF